MRLFPKRKAGFSRAENKCFKPLPQYFSTRPWSRFRGPALRQQHDKSRRGAYRWRHRHGGGLFLGHPPVSHMYLALSNYYERVCPSARLHASLSKAALPFWNSCTLSLPLLKGVGLFFANLLWYENISQTMNLYLITIGCAIPFAIAFRILLLKIIL